LFPNHGYKARAEFKAGSCDWLRQLWWLYELDLGAERFWIERFSMVKEKDKRKEKVKDRIHGQTRFEDNYNNRSPATAPKMLVGIS